MLDPATVVVAGGNMYTELIRRPRPVVGQINTCCLCFRS